VQFFHSWATQLPQRPEFIFLQKNKIKIIGVLIFSTAALTSFVIAAARKCPRHGAARWRPHTQVCLG